MSMNQARWDGLPPDIQQAFRDASGPDWLVELGQIWRRNDDAAIEVLVAAGDTHVTLDEAETAAFAQALDPVVARWVAEMDDQGIDGAALVERARALIDEEG
jgi:TRAP-type C4-dicarboxylate transport system substrate-binding protein